LRDFDAGKRILQRHRAGDLAVGDELAGLVEDLSMKRFEEGGWVDRTGQKAVALIVQED
jgi:hypothetical protein